MAKESSCKSKFIITHEQGVHNALSLKNYIIFGNKFSFSYIADSGAILMMLALGKNHQTTGQNQNFLSWGEC